MRTVLLTVVLAVAFSMVFRGYARADSAIDANAFTYDTAQKVDANDFHIEISGTFKDAPESDVFPNRTYSGGKADFSGSTVPPGGSHNVKFKSTGDKPAPKGQFTKDGKNVGGVVKSKALDGTTVAYVPNGTGGYAVTLTITNEFGSPLSGTCAVYICAGHDAHFDPEKFDNPMWIVGMVMPPTPYLFPNGMGFPPLMFPLASDDQYILITGTADAGDGAGSFDFSIGLSPVEEEIPLGQVRRQPDGNHVLTSGIVTHVGTDGSGNAYFYIEEETRASAIRCSWAFRPPGAEVPLEDLQGVVGILGTLDGERVIYVTEPLEPSQLHVGLPDPFDMRARDVGGGDLDMWNPGVTRGRGALNVGLRVHVSGMLTAVDPSPTPQWFYIWDGTNGVDEYGNCAPLQDGTGNIGLRIIFPPICVLWGDWVEVTGVVSTEADIVPGRVIAEILPIEGAKNPEFDIVSSEVVPRPPFFLPDALLPGWNLFSLPAAPAALGTGVPPPFAPMPWDPPTVLGVTTEQLDGRLYRWEQQTLSQIMYDMWVEPMGVFGGLILGDGYWLSLDRALRCNYSAHTSHLDQWIGVCVPGWTMMGLPRLSDTPLAGLRVHEGGDIKTLREASQYGLGWVQSIGFWWENQTQSQYDIGLPEDWPSTDTMYPWSGYWFVAKEGNKSYLIPGEPELEFNQIDFIIQGVSTPNSSWGDCDLTYTGTEDVMYFNLAVNGNWVVQNVPVMSGDGIGKRQTVGFNFDLGVPPGTNVPSLHYVYSLTSGELPGGPPGTPVWTAVGDVTVRMNSGIKAAVIPQPTIAPLLTTAASVAIAVARATFPNQECPNLGECVPTAVSNSLKYLNGLNGLGLTDAQTSIGTMKTATGYDPSPPPGCYSNWPTTKDNYMKANGYPINTTTTNNWDDVVTAVNNGADVELRSPTHCATVTAASKGADGKYTFTVSHDTDQGNAGGTKTETVVYDPATGKYTGGAGFDGQTARPTCIETAKK